jgi:hypothetical protein
MLVAERFMVNKRSLAVAMISLCPVNAMAQQAQPTALSGIRTHITQHYGTDVDCKAQHIILQLGASPTHGTVTFKKELITVPERNGQGELQRCAGKRVLGTGVYYKSRGGFKGDDNFTYSRANADDAYDRYNRDFTITVTVH